MSCLNMPFMKYSLITNLIHCSSWCYNLKVLSVSIMAAVNHMHAIPKDTGQDRGLDRLYFCNYWRWIDGNRYASTVCREGATRN